MACRPSLKILKTLKTPEGDRGGSGFEDIEDIEEASEERVFVRPSVPKVSGSPADWLARMEGTAIPAAITADRWQRAIDAMRELVTSGAAAECLALGWHPLELVGANRRQPHDAPHVAGLIFSWWPGDLVRSVRPTGCIIAYGNVRHIWRRVPLAAE